MKTKNNYLDTLLSNSIYERFYINLNYCDDTQSFKVAEYLHNRGYKWSNGTQLNIKSYFRDMTRYTWKYLIAGIKTKRVLRSTYSQDQDHKIILVLVENILRND